MNNPCIMCGSPIPEGFGQVCAVCEADVRAGLIPSRWEAQRNLQTNTEVGGAHLKKGKKINEADSFEPPRSHGGERRKG